MSFSIHVTVVSAAGVLLAAAGCSSTPPVPPAADVAVDAGVAIEGVIVGIDTQPWTYDGHAVIAVDSDARGRVAVQLPARWNLCKAEPVDVEALAVGMRISAVGSLGAEGELVVCGDATHRLVPVTGPAPD